MTFTVEIFISAYLLMTKKWILKMKKWTLEVYFPKKAAILR